jgi:hypothetical protein
VLLVLQDLALPGISKQGSLTVPLWLGDGMSADSAAGLNQCNSEEVQLLQRSGLGSAQTSHGSLIINE